MKICLVFDPKVTPSMTTSDIYRLYFKLCSVQKTFEKASNGAYKTDNGIPASIVATRGVMASYLRMVLTSFMGKKGWEGILSDMWANEDITTYLDQYKELSTNLYMLLKCKYCDPAYPEPVVNCYLPQGATDGETDTALDMLGISRRSIQANENLENAIEKINNGEDICILVNVPDLPATRLVVSDYAPFAQIAAAGVAAGADFVTLAEY